MAALASSATADAQSARPGASANGVLARTRPGYDAAGIRIGSFALTPSVAVSLAYDDNVYSVARPRISDRFIVIEPNLPLHSNWGRHSLTIDASSTIQRYQRRKSENSEQHRLRAAGRLDVMRGFTLSADARHARLVEPRGTTGDLLPGGEPTVYRLTGGTLNADKEFGPWRLGARGSIDRTRFRPVRVGGVRVSQAYRDHTDRSAGMRLTYAGAPSIGIFVDGTLFETLYDRLPAQFDRDSRGLSLLGGIGFDVTELLSGEVGIGYLRASFSDPRFRRISGIGYNGSLTWNPTALLTVTASARKSLVQGPDIGVNNIVQQDVRVGADHELLRNLLLNATLGYVSDSYRGSGRTDRRYSGRIGALYLVNRYVAAGLSYDHRRQVSNGPTGREYRGNTVRATLVLRR